MKIEELLDMSLVNQLVNDGLITLREHEGLCILNYSDKAAYTKGAFDIPEVRMCRGIIFDFFTRDVVARSIPKFFNWGQEGNGEWDLDTPVVVTDKVDGSLGIGYYRDGKPCVSIRGSMESDQAVHATHVLQNRYSGWTWPVGYTPLWEIIYPDNRIVLDYGQMDDLVLIGVVNIHNGRFIPSTSAQEIFVWPGPVAETLSHTTLREALEAEPRKNKEGLVVFDVNGNRHTKIKQQDYIDLHRIVTNLSEKTVWQAIVEGKSFEEFVEGLPDKWLDWVRDIWKRIMDSATDLHQQVVDAWVRINLHNYEAPQSRADFAKYAKEEGPLAKYLFRMYDHKPASLADYAKEFKPKKED